MLPIMSKKLAPPDEGAGTGLGAAAAGAMEADGAPWKSSKSSGTSASSSSASRSQNRHILAAFTVEVGRKGRWCRLRRTAGTSATEGLVIVKVEQIDFLMSRCRLLCNHRRILLDRSGRTSSCAAPTAAASSAWGRSGRAVVVVASIVLFERFAIRGASASTPAAGRGIRGRGVGLGRHGCEGPHRLFSRTVANAWPSAGRLSVDSQ